MKDIKEYINEKQIMPTVYLSVADAEELVKFIKNNKLEKDAEKTDWYLLIRQQIA